MLILLNKDILILIVLRSCGIGVNVDRGTFIPLVYIYVDSKFFWQTVVIRSLALGVTQNTVLEI